MTVLSSVTAQHVTMMGRSDQILNTKSGRKNPESNAIIPIYMQGRKRESTQEEYTKKQDCRAFVDNPYAHLV